MKLYSNESEQNGRVRQLIVFPFSYTRVDDVSAFCILNRLIYARVGKEKRFLKFTWGKENA